MRRRSTLAAGVACLSLAGCLDGLFGDTDAGGIAPPGAGVGATCERDSQCRSTLRCDPAARVCALRGDSMAGANCVLTGECSAGLFCSAAGVCATAGAAADGETCGDAASCQRGLVCLRGAGELFGLCRAPRGSALAT
ncbi:MAG: hypothetical protein Q8S73_26060, partial [Deltaproteobacteria bacterium]|nr:hypothetical protein [Deltaproteobacteria bacterium]